MNVEQDPETGERSFDEGPLHTAAAAAVVAVGFLKATWRHEDHSTEDKSLSQLQLGLGIEFTNKSSSSGAKFAIGCHSGVSRNTKQQTTADGLRSQDCTPEECTTFGELQVRSQLYVQLRIQAAFTHYQPFAVLFFVFLALSKRLSSQSFMRMRCDVAPGSKSDWSASHRRAAASDDECLRRAYDKNCEQDPRTRTAVGQSGFR
jgi:hypothetical protein